MPGSVTCSLIGNPAWGTYDDVAGDDSIHILHGDVNDLALLYDQFFAFLDPAEKQRAQRYYQMQDQQHYVVRHGLLRLLLARHLNAPASRLAFAFNVNKKPALSPQGKVFFNISHSAHHFLIAISGSEIGVDIEHINPGFEYRDIAGNYFSPAEVRCLDTAADPLKAFFLLWTRKEALLKACGMGIDDDLPAVPALDGTGTLPGNYPPVNWLTESFSIGEAFMGSVTYPLPKVQLHFSELTGPAVAALLSAV